MSENDDKALEDVVHLGDLPAQKHRATTADAKQNGYVADDTGHTSDSRVQKSKKSFAAYDKMKRMFTPKSKDATTTSHRHNRHKTNSMPSENGVKRGSSVASSSPPTSPRPTEEESDTDFSIPSDGNMSTFSPEQLVQFFKYLNLDDKTISKLCRRKMDGRRFSKMTDADLDRYGINTPIVVYFRDRSEIRRTGSRVFML